MSASVEVERKFAVERGQALPDLEPLLEAGEPETFDLSATYFDTPDLLLARNRRTLRRREGGDDQGWHLKTPGDGSGRHEFHEPLDASPDPILVPAALRARVSELIGRSALIPVASLNTTRIQTPLSANGQPVALLADDTVQATALPDGQPQTWREVEVELVGVGSEEVLAAVADRFAQAGVQPSSSVSKLAQTLGERVAAAEHPDAHSSAGAVVGGFLATQVGVLQSYQEELAVSAPDAVHKARVATRRMRSALRSFAPLFAEPARKRGRELKWMAQVLGVARDAEVLQQRLAGHSEVLDWVLADRHARAHADLVAAMNTPRWSTTLAALTAFVADLPLTEAAAEPAYQMLPGLLRVAEEEPVTVAEQAHQASGAERLHLMHEVRKAAKRARYAAEAAGAAHDAELWEEVTEALGQTQDCVVAVQTLTEIAAEHAGSPQAAVLEHYAAEQESQLEAFIVQGEAALSRAVRGLPS